MDECGVDLEEFKCAESALGVTSSSLILLYCDLSLSLSDILPFLRFISPRSCARPLFLSRWTWLVDIAGGDVELLGGPVRSSSILQDVN